MFESNCQIKKKEANKGSWRGIPSFWGLFFREIILFWKKRLQKNKFFFESKVTSFFRKVPPFFRKVPPFFKKVNTFYSKYHPSSTFQEQDIWGTQVFTLFSRVYFILGLLFPFSLFSLFCLGSILSRSIYSWVYYFHSHSFHYFVLGRFCLGRFILGSILSTVYFIWGDFIGSIITGEIYSGEICSGHALVSRVSGQIE